MTSTATARAVNTVIGRKLESIQKKGGIQSVDIANILGTRPETVSRWNQGKAFPQPEKEKLLLELEYVVEQLADFYEPDEARLWLFSRQKLLNGQTPAKLIQEAKIDQVLELISQLRDGVYV